ncbi:hypothetical protein ACFQ3S_05510 [Mucilaginibacter terrae]|uniref:hypothetical protein n=1 Tax=Mucilaginibacter terrae TaxID=1955052 RepID=UPI00362856FF
MKAKEFVQEILARKPNIKDFEGLDQPTSYSYRRIEEFKVIKLSDQQYENEIFNLILNYDITSLSVHAISFESEYQEDDEYYYVGYDVGPDRIVINKSNGKISALEPYSGNLIFHCAENAESFFDALIEVMKFSKEKMLNDYSEEQRDNRATEVAYIAGLKAGGEEYEEYYRATLGV